MQGDVFFEGDEVDTRSTIHPATKSIPGFSGVVSGTSCHPAQAATDSSEIFSIDNQAVSHSGTKKIQNTGNCPVSPMVLSSHHSVRFFVSK